VTTLDDPNPALWVRLSSQESTHADLRWLIAGSARTHRGHFHVCSADGEHHRSVNLADVAEASGPARTWIDGFLHGQEATLWEFLGEDIALYDAAGPDDEQRLNAWNRRFLELGYGPRLEVLPARSAALDKVDPPLPWCYVGGLFRVWSQNEWRVAVPQPPSEDDSGWLWPGSECAYLDEHDLGDDGEFSLCGRCHRVSTI